MFYQIQIGYPCDVWANLQDTYINQKEALSHLKYWRQVCPNNIYRLVKYEVLDD